MAFLRPDGTIGGGIDFNVDPRPYGPGNMPTPTGPYGNYPSAQQMMGLMNQNMTGARVKPQHPGAPMARDSITDATFQQFGTPSSYAGVARAGLAATPWVQELAQMGLQRAGDLGQYAAAGPAQLAALQQEAAANTGARAGLQQIEQAGLGGLGAMQRVMGAGPSAYEQAGGAGLRDIQAFGQAGQDALQQQRAMAGLSGPEAQQQAISGVQSSPMFKALQDQQRTAILQNAAATGGLRGGNTQRALAEMESGLLAQEIGRQEGRLGALANRGAGMSQGLMGAGMSELARRQQMQAGLGQSLAGMAQGSLGNRYSTGLGLRQGLMGQGLSTSQYMTGLGGNLAQTLMGSGQNAIGNIAQMGANAAAQQGTQAMQSGANIANLMQQAGQGQANAALARGAAQAGMWNNLAGVGNAFLSRGIQQGAFDGLFNRSPNIGTTPITGQQMMSGQQGVIHDL